MTNYISYLLFTYGFIRYLVRIFYLLALIKGPFEVEVDKKNIRRKKELYVKYVRKPYGVFPA